jgi:sugar O-acyltransferase (sialic acid O-acetyltransferase NeuD family)
VDLYGVVGAGGFGREVMPLAVEMLAVSQTRNFELVFVIEGLTAETTVNGHRIISKESFVAHRTGERYFSIAIADAMIRMRIAAELLGHGCKPFQISAPNSVVLANNKIGEGAILCPFATIGSNVKIGCFFHANVYSYLAHDCLIGDYVTFAPKVACGGGVSVEDFAFLGAGAIVRQGSPERPITIGKGAVVGMGAVVTKSVAPYTVVVGIPAGPLTKKAV